MQNAADRVNCRHDDKVSVIMPCYNHEQFVEDAVRSVWRQTHENVELICIDDGSSDATASILEKLQPDSPIQMQVVRKENEGVCKTLNRGVVLAEGQWFAFLASDDAYAEDFIAACLDTMDIYEDANSIVLHCDAWRMDEGSRTFGRIYESSPVPPVKGDSFLDLSFGRGRVIAITLFLSRDLLERTGPFDETLVSEDFDYHLRLSKHAEFHFIDRPLAYCRVLPTSLGRSPRKWASDGVKILSKHKDDLGCRYAEALSSKHFRNFSVFCQNGFFVDSFGDARECLALAEMSSLPRLLLQMAHTLAYSLTKRIVLRLADLARFRKSERTTGS